MNRKITLLILATICLAWHSQAQTGVNTQSPDSSSVLDVWATDKGLLIPRVNLTSVTMDLDGAEGQAEGLLVFNIGTTLDPGFYYWDGEQWKGIVSMVAIAPEIESLVCAQATLDPTNLEAGTSYTGIMRVPYTGGNGGAYGQGEWINSTGNTGLQARLKPGTLEYGNGFLVFDVEGTPTANSPNGASFAFEFGTATPQSCTITVGNQDPPAVTSSIATLGPLAATTEGVTGFHRMLTSPDGKFSVRVIVPNGTNLSGADLQVRSNDNATTIMWNGGSMYDGGFVGDGGNALALSADVWSGTWGDADVYFNAPEQRYYMWTSTNIDDRTMYRLTFMMGAPSPNVGANETTAAQVKAYLSIEQIVAN